MAAARQCDRCNRYFQLDEERNFPHVNWGLSDIMGGFARNTKINNMDLCPECFAGLNSFLTQVDEEQADEHTS